MQKKILLVEDEPNIADSITYALSTDGFEAKWCKTGRDAIKTIASGKIDLVILDVGLPDMSGFDVCKEIHKISSVPVIFLTARASETDKVVGLELGGDDYIVKPFSPRELTARVKAVLRRVSEKDAPMSKKDSAGPFAIDRKRMKVSYFGKPVDLSRYEFKILDVLIGRPGWVFTRDKLMEMVWESPEASLDRTVDTHIKTIRAKLKDIKSKLDPIETHRGTGYSLREDIKH